LHQPANLSGNLKKLTSHLKRQRFFTCQANELLDVTGRILNAARKTGKVFSFTVIKSKT
jgi:hypothetical protein